MRFWGALGAALVLATILSFKLDGQAFALLTGMLAMAVVAVGAMLLFASKNQCEQHSMARQQEQQPVAPVLIVLNSQPQYGTSTMPTLTDRRQQIDALRGGMGWYKPEPVEQPVWTAEQERQFWDTKPAGLWDEPEPQAQRRFKVVGKKEPWGEDR